MHYPSIRTSIPALLATSLVAIVLCLMSPDSSHAATADITPAAATADFYAKISARDLGGVMHYVPADGFTEIGVGAEETHRIDEHSFADFFKSELAINLRAVNLSFQEFGDTAIVTGIRAGSITPKGAPATESRHFFTMIWLKSDGVWQLHHVHLSSIESVN